MIPSYVAALALLGAFGPKGLLQDVLEPAGVERLPEIYGYGGALLALSLSTFPYVFLIAAAALRSVDPSIEEAARSLGRSPRQVFFSVTLPPSVPGLPPRRSSSRSTCSRTSVPSRSCSTRR